MRRELVGCKSDLVVVNINCSGVDAAEGYKVSKARATVDGGRVVHVRSIDANVDKMFVENLLSADVRGKRDRNCPEEQAK